MKRNLTGEQRKKKTQHEGEHNKEQGKTDNIYKHRLTREWETE